MMLNKENIQKFLHSENKHAIIRGDGYSENFSIDENFADILRFLRDEFNDSKEIKQIKVLIRFVDNNQKDRVFKGICGKIDSHTVYEMDKLRLYIDTTNSYNKTPNDFDIVIIYSAGTMQTTKKVFMDSANKAAYKVFWVFKDNETSLEPIKEFLEIGADSTFERDCNDTTYSNPYDFTLERMQVEGLHHSEIERGIMKLYGNNSYVETSSGVEHQKGKINEITIIPNKGKTINCFARMSKNFDDNKEILVLGI